MHVDQAGQQGHARQVDASSASRHLNIASRADGGDPAVGDDHHWLLHHSSRHDVDQTVGADRDDLSVCCRGLGKCNENGDNRRVMTHL